ncbi:MULTISPECIES: methyl-accepting chemotaxis protein [Sporomusa]|uniref:methyl-accepting chemotaxis protein n=1 Tax=Sporomusa TaxID=2375 RepID=UPI0031590851
MQNILQAFNNLKLFYKLGLLIAVALIMLAVVGWTNFTTLNKANTTLNYVNYDLLDSINNLGKMRVRISNINNDLLETMLTTDPRKNQALLQSIQTHVRENDDFLTQIKAHADKIPGSKPFLASLETARVEYHEVREQVLSLAAQNKNAEAYALYVEKVDDRTKAFSQAGQDLAEHYSQEADKNAINSQAEFNETIYRIIASLAVAFLLLVASGLAITRGITVPLAGIIATCQDFARGDFRDKQSVTARRDEIGQLADTLAATRSSLQILFQQIHQSVEQVSSSSEELTASADQVAQTANSVAASVIEVAGALQNQLTGATATAAAIDQMAANADQIAANAQAAAGSSAHSVQQAEQGKLSLNHSIEQMGKIEQTTTAVADVVTKLGNRSREIGQIVDTISGIAGQTNLLALNAAIEAARAGEQGRGFAVVAEEVRKLAEQSQEAAKQIAGLIGEIQTDTEKAVTDMQTGTAEVRQGVESVNASGQAFQIILQSIEQVSVQIGEIAQAVRQMAGSITEVRRSSQESETLSQHASSQSQAITAATEQQLASMQEIAAASNALAKLGETLQTEVQKFQI